MDELADVQDCAELREAVKAAGKHPTPTVRRHLIRKAVELGCTDNIPDEWEAT